MNLHVALAFRGATVGYGESAIVGRADLAVASGEVVGLVGPNGAGKSTLLRAVTGAARVLEGVVEVEGCDVGTLPSLERARLVGVVPQSVAVPFSFTARRFVEMGRHPHLGPLQPLSASDDAAVALAMERTDTARLSRMTVDTLSGGDLQRLTLAQALAQTPRVLLLDEPTSHLDLNHRLQVLDLVRELADGGMAVLAVFHDLDLAARYADRIAVVAAGCLRAPASPREALRADVIAEVFGVAAVVGTDPVTGSVTVTPVARGADIVPTRPERVLVVSGSGTGARLMRRLALAGFRVAAGALDRGDVDESVASSLGLEHVALPPFGEVDETAEAAVRALAAASDATVVCAGPFGRANLGNLRAALSSPRLVTVGRLREADDFTGGEALRLWDEILAAGASRADDEADVVTLLVAAMGGDGGSG
ncbi:MAG: ABC transporter ATP-binding protein [Coriobacteriia bacterium]